MAKNFKNPTANEFYQFGVTHYKQTQQLEEEGANEVQINAGWNLAAGDFWMALALGHFSAPYSLCMCFNQALGVRYDEYLVKLLFGVALELGDEKCQRKINEIKVPPTMNEAVKSLAQLIRDTKAATPNDREVSMETVNSQMDKFDAAIVLPNNQTMYGLLKPPKGADPSTAYYDPTDRPNHQENTKLLGGDHPAEDDCCCVLI